MHGIAKASGVVLCGIGMLLCVGGAAGGALGAATVQEGRTIPPDPTEILRKGREAAAGLVLVSYKATTTGAASGSMPEITADVTLVPAKELEGGLGARVWMQGEAGAVDARNRFAVSFDSKVATIVDHAARTAIRAEGTEAPKAIEEFQASDRGAVLALTPLLRGIDAKDARVRYIGQETIDGVPCEVVEVPSASADPATTIALGAADHLARRIARGDAAVTFTGLKTTAGESGGKFSVAVPASYKVEKRGAPAPKPAPKPVPKPVVKGAPGLLPIGSKAPDWTLKDADGNDVALSKLKGSVVVIDFWATWCGPCRKAMPSVQRIHKEYKDRGVRVYGIDTWEKGPGDPRKVMKDQGFTYGLLMNGDDVAKKYKVTGIPTFYVIGADGRIIFNAVGFSAEEEKTIGAVIEAHLAEQGKK